MDRRRLLKQLALASATAVLGPRIAASESQETPLKEPLGVLVDLTQCIGCRKCEFACNQAGDFEHKPVSAFEDPPIPARRRVHDPDTFTVINAYDVQSSDPVFVKTQCYHCLDPACYSACLVTAFDRHPDGPVTYDAGKCMGCRYCMVACPFEVPAFEYDRAATPRIRKCDFCAHRLAENKLPACVEICPVQCMTFGHRNDLIALAHARIESHHGTYLDHVFGEREVGGTSWMYLSSVPFESLGFPKLPDEAPPRLIEGIQHSVFKACLAPLLVAGFLGGTMIALDPDRSTEDPSRASDGADKP